jgi:hypothetical protein
MKFLALAFLFLVPFSVQSQGIYSDFGIERIYCFSNDADIELELVQNDNVLHTFSSQGGDIFNLRESVTVESVPNGVSFYLPDIDRSTIVVVIDESDNVKFEGLSALTGTQTEFSFECELN